jgi:hypothetical protein
MSIEFSPIKLSHIHEFNEIMQNHIHVPKFLKVTKMDTKKEGSSHYKVITYDKNILTRDLIPTYGLCRSIILDRNHKIISYAPPKSVPSDSFIQQYSLQDSSIIVEEFVEGTMINVFWDETIGVTGAWEIATRNTVGATSCFFKSPKSKTFRTMFLEACKDNQLELDHLNKEYCYSFVLQHPENRMVVPFKVSKLYLAAVYLMEHSKEMTVYSMHLDNITNEIKQHLGIEKSQVLFPNKYDDAPSYSSLIEKYASMNTPYDVLGVVIYNKKTGERTKIRNPVYEQVRQLRGNQPKLQYQYLNLRNQGKIAEFLKYFSENKKEFSEFRDQVHLFTNTLFSNYLSCYIKKEKPLMEFSEQYRTHMFHLHKKYLDELRENKLFITSKIVKKYVNEMHPALLMYSLNYPLRKRNTDLIQNQTETETKME